MARNQNRGGGGLVYHWRHGWIPRTPTAALQKAHGSRKGADKLMSRHGIEGDLPAGAGKKTDVPSTSKSSTATGVAKSHPVGARVAARQPGIDNETQGRVVGHTDNGMVRVRYKDRRGNDVTGTFNPSHTRVAEAGGSKPPVADKPHTLKPGERATVRGTDEYGQPATFTGIVRANGEVSAYAKGRKTGGQPLRSISIEREDNSRRQNVVYVPDPDRGEQRRGDADRAKVRDLPAEGNFSRSHSETFMGEKITVRKTETGRHETLINGEPFSAGYGSRNKDAVGALDQARKSIETMKSSNDPKFRGMYGMKPGTSAGEKPKPAKKYVLERTLPDGTVKRHPDAMFPKTASLAASYSLYDNGAASKADAQRAAKRLERINVGEEIEAGGYKFRLVEDRPDPKVEAGRQKVQADAQKTRAEQLREAAAKKRAEANRIANGAGVNDRAAAMLSGRTHQRQVARDDSALRRFAETSRRADALEARARSADARAAEAQRKAAAGALNLKSSDVSPGDLIVANGTPTLVQKVNKTTVSIPSVVGGSWDDRVELSKVSRHIKVADLKDNNLRALHAKATGAAKDALGAEMRRRGLKPAA